MSPTSTAGFRSGMPAGRDGFWQLVHAEWTKLRTVRGWLIGLLVAAVLIIGLGVVTAAGQNSGQVCHSVGGRSAPICTHAGPQAPLTGPGGVPVEDGFYSVHQQLHGDGSITVQVGSLTGLVASAAAPPGQPLADAHSGLQPWAKAGLIIEAGSAPGSRYAAIMATGAHGVRFQYDYTHDSAGLGGPVSAGSPRWLRLRRSGDVITGYDSTDGSHWSAVGSTHLTGLAETVTGGMFTASPDLQQTGHPVGGGESGSSVPTQATARFDRLSLGGGWTSGSWSGTATGDRVLAGGFTQQGGIFTVSGSGDIAPLVPGTGPLDPDRSMTGSFAGLLAVIVVAGLFVTAEFRRGLMRTTFTASPRRGRVLAAKAVVIGGAAFVTGLVAAAVTIPLGRHLMRSGGHFVWPLDAGTALRIVLGTGALTAVVAVTALALGSILRRGAGTVTAVVVAIVLPYILAVASILPVGAAQWLLRLTPAAAFSVQQTMVRYPQVAGDYIPTNGYYPLSPWVGFAVLCGYAAVALAVAAVLLRRRDA